MEKLDNLIDRLRAIEDEALMLVENVIRENEHALLSLNSRDQLYDRGIDRNGVEIASYRPYAPMTIQIKREKGQPTNRVTLRDEGNFYASFYIIFGATGFEIAASDWKTEELIAKYGEEVLGLTDENVRLFAAEYIEPALNELFAKI